MGEYDEEVIAVFLRDQGRLFDEPVAETPEEAEEFLSDCLAVVAGSAGEVWEYFEESGADLEDMSREEILEISEVFALPGGRYLIVEA